MNIHEKTVRVAIREILDKTVGAYENSYIDEPDRFTPYGDLYGIHSSNIVSEIYSELVSYNDAHICENGLILEKKHIRFFGKNKIKKTIDEICKQDIRTNGWKFDFINDFGE